MYDKTVLIVIPYTLLYKYFRDNVLVALSAHKSRYWPAVQKVKTVVQP